MTPDKEWIWTNFLRGKADFRAGRPRPPVPRTKYGRITKPKHAQWYGWMMARAEKLQAEWRAKERAEAIRRWAEEGGPLPID